MVGSWNLKYSQPKGLNKVQEKEMAEQNLILKVRTGSHLYGTNTEKSDLDTVGLCIPNIEYVVGNKHFEQYQYNSNPSSSGHRNTAQDEDITIYSLPKFLHLLAGCNPNITEIPFAPANCILFCNKYGQMILDNTKLFLNQRCYYSFSGYAHSQEKKMCTKDPIGSRKELVDTYGYDVKFGMHLIRLYYECIELLKDECITLPHIQVRKLIDIKQGKYKLEDILAEANRLQILTDEVWATTKLPKHPDLEAINKLQIDMLVSFWKETGQL